MNRLWDRGAVLVETAIVLNLLIILIVGIISFGVLLGYQQTLVRATADAARAVSITADGDLQASRALAAMNLALASTSRSCSDLAITCDLSAPAACINNPAELCRTIRIDHDHFIDPIVARIPIISMVLPERSSSEATVSVNSGTP